MQAARDPPPCPHAHGHLSLKHRCSPRKRRTEATGSGEKSCLKCRKDSGLFFENENLCFHCLLTPALDSDRGREPLSGRNSWPDGTLFGLEEGPSDAQRQSGGEQGEELQAGGSSGEGQRRDGVQELEYGHGGRGSDQAGPPSEYSKGRHWADHARDPPPQPSRPQQYRKVHGLCKDKRPPEHRPRVCRERLPRQHG